MEYREFTGKTVEDAVVEAAVQLGTTSDRMEYEILEKGSNGFLGIGSRPAKIRARKILETDVQNSSWQMFLMQWILR